MKKLSVFWAALVGLFSVVWQVGSFYLRFGRLNELASPLDYIIFFLSGTLGGLILIYFLNRQPTSKGWWVVLAAFVLVSPAALFMMIGGALLGPLGVLIFPQIPWALFTWIGSLVARLVKRNG
jgi:hypothetical protein